VALSFTPNIGLTKFTESELALNWARVQNLASANNLIIIDKMDVNLITYTPALIGPTTNPSVGAGAALGEYYDFQGFIFGSFSLQFTDPGVNTGTGTGAYGISLPVLLDNTFHNLGTALNNAPGPYVCVGEGYFIDASGTPASSGTTALDVVRIGGVDYLRMISEPYGGKTVEWYGPSVPFAVQTGDQWTGQFCYKKA
jgi:hypothetical protein